MDPLLATMQYVASSTSSYYAIPHSPIVWIEIQFKLFIHVCKMYMMKNLTFMTTLYRAWIIILMGSIQRFILSCIYWASRILYYINLMLVFCGSIPLIYWQFIIVLTSQLETCWTFVFIMHLLYVDTHTYCISKFQLWWVWHKHKHMQHAHTHNYMFPQMILVNYPERWRLAHLGRCLQFSYRLKITLSPLLEV